MKWDNFLNTQTLILVRIYFKIVISGMLFQNENWSLRIKLYDRINTKIIDLVEKYGSDKVFTLKLLNEFKTAIFKVF